MNYIVLDLEWNQALNQSNRIDKLQFEIIEIGAVKLDENFNEISRYESLIKPVVYKKIHPIIMDITKIRNKELQKERNFPTVIREFFEWCGEDFVLCTYGNQDLTELQNNMEYYNLNTKNDNPFWEYPLMYIDVQKIFGIQFNEMSEQKSLGSAAKQIHIPLDKKFHRALEDAIYTGQILAKLDKDIIKKNYSLDYYRVPITKREEREIKVSDHNEYISRAYQSKDELLEQPHIYVTRCVACGKKCRKKIRWFTDNSKYTCVAICPEHGIMEGTIHVKYNRIRSFYYVVRKVVQIDEEMQETIVNRKENIRQRRRQKRQRVKNKFNNDLY